MNPTTPAELNALPAGTVILTGDGYASVIRPCERCNRPTRPVGWRKDRAPGTVVRATKTLCMACYARDAKRGIRHPSDAHVDAEKRVQVAACVRCGHERTVNKGRNTGGLCRDCRYVLTDAEVKLWAA